VLGNTTIVMLTSLSHYQNQLIFNRMIKESRNHIISEQWLKDLICTIGICRTKIM